MPFMVTDSDGSKRLSKTKITAIIGTIVVVAGFFGIEVAEEMQTKIVEVLMFLAAFFLRDGIDSSS